ncbi:UNVERIFIED_CONTAM: hypothetical protein GTU68_029688 [Idotea baltica]|nr:hypothetical protein [Idotea baltica]
MDFSKLSVSELQSGLEKKDFTSTEITKDLISKIKEDKTNSFLTIAEEQALKLAETADQKIQSGEKGDLLGIPVAVKDLILTKGIRTTSGSKILDNFIPPYNATVTNKLLDSGAVIIGKTNMDEFAMGSSNENSAYGNVANPVDLERVPGGSSGGSAACVAGNLSPLSLGTDTGGSIRQPASFCGIVGMKPTYGRVSRYGVIAFASSLDQVGPFSRNVEDCAKITKVISGKDNLDSTSVDQEVPNFEKSLGQDIKGMRIGIPKEYFIKGLDPEIESAVKNSIKEIEKLGAEIVEISLPNTEAAVATYYIIAPAEASSNLARYDGVRYGHRAENRFGEEVKRRILIGTYVLSSGYYDAYYIHAQKIRTLIANDFKNAFKDQCDLIVCPTAPGTAFKMGENVNDPIKMYLNDVFTIPASLAGLPAMSIPCGVDSKNLPIGLQIIGKPWDEENVFKLGYAFEQSRKN